MQRLKRLISATPTLAVTKKGSGPALVFLHGIGSSSENWDILVQELAPDYTCITIDLLGFGASPKPSWSNYTIEEHVKSIAKTIKKLHLEEPYTLIGHSLGSLLATRYAASRSSEIKQLILVSPPIYLHPTQYRSGKARMTTNAYLKIYKYMRSHKKFTLRNAGYIAKLLPNPHVINLDESTWPAFTKTMEHCIENQTAITDIVQIQAPVEVIYGSLDQFIIPENMKILDALENTHVTLVKNADHVIRKRIAQAITQKIRNL